MVVKSKIKTLFNEPLRRHIAAICDTKQIQNNILKMDLAQRLLVTNGLQLEQLGGATNRYVVMVDGYATKIAVDRQGFKDNYMEYALTQESPHFTKSYEVNGYMLVQECVRNLTKEEWRLRKSEILKILDELGRDYLLGDVGYWDDNMTNWGVRDNGELVILDYAYCHKLTEDLFTCPVCGSLLSYDQNFTSFICTDRANCHARYTYNQIKARQGDAVDWNMIKEKQRRSIVIPKEKNEVVVNRDSDLLVDSKTFVIRSYQDLNSYKEAKNNMLTLDYSNPEVMELITELTMLKVRPVLDKDRIAEIESRLNDLKEPEQEVRCIVDPEFQQKLLDDQYAEQENEVYRNSSANDDESDDTDDSKYDIGNLLAKLGNTEIVDAVPNDQVDWSDSPISTESLLSNYGEKPESEQAEEGQSEDEPEQLQDDDVIGEPESELESSVESELPQAVDLSDSFTDEPVSAVDDVCDDGESVPIDISCIEEDGSDPERVYFDDSSLNDEEEGMVNGE